MKYLLAGLGLLAFMSTAQAQNIDPDVQPLIDNLQQQIDVIPVPTPPYDDTVLQAQVAALQTQINALQVQVDALPAPYDDAAILSLIADLEARIVALESFHTAPPPANGPPVAVNDSATTNQDTAVLIPVLANDSDPDDNPLSITLVEQGVNGSVGISGADVLYTPNTGFFGSDSFSYTVSDGAATAVGSVSVTVNEVVPPPTSNLMATIAAMPPGSWLPYGNPWSDLNPPDPVTGIRPLDACGGTMANAFGSWTGSVYDAEGNPYIVTPGGHSAGCAEYILRMNLETGNPELVVAHGDPQNDGSGVWYSKDENGNQLVPTATHNYNCLQLKADGYIYRCTTISYQTNGDPSAWRINLADALATDPVSARDLWEKLPAPPGAIQPYGRYALLSDDSSYIATTQGLFAYDWNTGVVSSNQKSDYYFDNSGAVTYGDNNTIWTWTKSNILYGDWVKLVRNPDGVSWTEERVSPNPVDWPHRAGTAVCLVPTPNGTVPVMWNAHKDLAYWPLDGDVKILPSTGGPAEDLYRIPYDRFKWIESLGVCVAVDRPQDGVWFYKPDIDVLMAPTGGTAAIDAMAPGTWLAYGQPWNTLNQNGERNFCGQPFRYVFDAWTSAVFDDDGNAYLVRGGGHSDGCDQSVYKYDIDAGVPTVLIEHIPPTLVGGTTNLYLTLDPAGNQIQPCATHHYNSLHLIDGYIYTVTSICYQTWGGHSTWRLDLAEANAATNPDIANDAWEQIPDFSSTSLSLLAVLDDGTTFSFNQYLTCEYSWVAATCPNVSQQWYADTVQSVVYGGNDTIWIRASFENNPFMLHKISRNGSVLTEERSSQTPAGWNLGHGGACLVPTASGVVPIFWGSDERLAMWPTTGDVVILDSTGGPAAKSGRNVYGKWKWNARLGVCIGVDTENDGLWIYKPDLAALGGAAPPSGGATLFFDDFENPVQLAGTQPTECMGPEAIGTCYYGQWRWAALPERDNTTGPTIVNGALRFTIPSQSGASRAGSYNANFIEGTQPLVPGDKVEIQFKWRASCSFIYMDCDPASPGFKTNRRSYDLSGGGSTVAKLAILGTGDDPNGQFPTTSCSQLETVITHHIDHALVGYHNCGWYEGFSEPSDPPAPGYSWNNQPNGDGRCDSNWGDPERHANWNDTNPECIKLDSDVWHTVRMQVDIVAWQSTREGAPLSNVKIFLDDKKVVDHQLYLAGPEFVGGGYGKLWILPYMTGKDATEVHPNAWVEYDDIRVCSPRCEV